MQRTVHGNYKGSYFSTALLLIAITSTTAFAQGTAFTYQGKLSDSGNPANGQYDFQIKLFDSATVGTGTQQGPTLTPPPVTVAVGIFTVQLDFGACASCFDGSARFLEIAVKPTSGSTFTTLNPRQQLTTSPYAIRSLSAANATTADGLSVSGGANYIQNTSSPQANSNFNISGNGTAGGTLSGGTVSGNIVNATMQFNLGGARIVGHLGSDNLFVGVNAGVSNPTGSGGNTFVGDKAGRFSTTAGSNSFFGSGAGQSTNGTANSFFGTAAGGGNNNTGSSNSLFGTEAGGIISSGISNAFFGAFAGQQTFSGSNDTLLGSETQLQEENLSNATAIGSRAAVGQNNALVLGSINGVNNCMPGNGCDSVTVGIGTTTPEALLDVERNGATFPETARFTTYGTDNKVLGRATGGSRLVPTATPLGRDLLLLGGTGYDGTSFVSSPKANVILEAAESWTSTANGTRIRFNTTLNGTTTISSSIPRMTIEDDGNVGIGTAAPLDKLHVNGIIRVATLGAADTTTTLCRNSSNQIAMCNSSSFRYKTNILPFTGGLDLVKRLRPITFTWKQGGSRDVGFGAEDVAKVEPLFTFTNDKGEIEGVKYDRINVALVNAVKEQQAEIHQEQAQIKQDQAQIKTQATALQREEQEIGQQRLVISSLMKLVCADHRRAHICK